MNGIEKEHWGIEAAATFKLTSELSLTAIGTWVKLNTPIIRMLY